MTTIQQIASLFDEIDTLDDLNRVIGLINSRRKQLDYQLTRDALSTFEQGDRVRLRNLSPKYVNGAAGTIDGVTGDRFYVRMDETVGVNSSRALERLGPRPSIPAQCLERIDQ